MKYLVADADEFNNPAFVRHDNSRPCFLDWNIYEDYADANNFVRDRLTKMDNPYISFVIVPIDTDNMEVVTLVDGDN